MPATRPTRTPKAGLLLLMAVALSLILAIPAPIARGDRLPTQDNGNASKTVTWLLNSTNELTLNGLEIANERLTLPWVTHNISWGDPGAFAANGILDTNLSRDSTNISLRSDATNYVADGELATGAPWTFESSPGGRVSANWSSTGLDAVFRHASTANNSLWDSLDSTTGWLGAPAGVMIHTNTTAQLEGAGMLGLNVTLPDAPDQWAGALRIAPVTGWSAYDRMIVWVLPLSVDSPMSFNVSAYINGTFHTTAARPLSPGWQEIEVDLTEFGPFRDYLASLTLRLNGRGVPLTQVYFDDIRVGSTKQFDETARAWQTITKATDTSAFAGNAVLQFNWSLLSATGVARTTGIVSVSGPSGTAQRPFSGPAGPGWRAFYADVSGTTVSAGEYDVSIAFEVVVDNASVSSVEARVDNVSLLFPNRHNGTFISEAVPVGSASEFTRVTWSFDANGPTAVQASLRSGNNTNPGTATWSSWLTWTASGAHSVSLPGASFIQVQVDLMTANASVGPLVQAMILETRHRSGVAGSAVSDIFRIPIAEIGAFQHWTSLRAIPAAPAGTSIAFSVGDGSTWQAVPADRNISTVNFTGIQWSATFTTTDGLVSPSLERVELVYEYLGPVVEIDLRSKDSLVVPAGGHILFTARALDAGGHVVSSAPSRFDWSTNDPKGRVFTDGTYEAGEVGVHTVTATDSRTSLFKSVEVTVRPADFWSDAVVPFAPYGLGILLIGALGYVAYEFAIRRMFAIDDVFLVSKDGRLLMHNTRRMRADRDEDILTGMLTAIVSFVKDSDPEENGDFRRFEVGGKTTLLERGTHVYLAAVYSGRVPRWAGKDLRRFMSALEWRFGDAFANWSGDPEDLQGLKEFTGQFVSRIRYRPPRRANGRAA